MPACLPDNCWEGRDAGDWEEGTRPRMDAADEQRLGANRLRDRLPSTLSDDFFQNLSRNVFLTAIAYQFLSLKISAMEISLHEIASIVKNACDDGTLDASTAIPLIYKISYPCQLSVMHKSKRRSTRIRRTANVSVAPEPYGAYKFTPSPMVLAARRGLTSTSRPALSKLPMKPGEHISTGVGSLQLNIYDPDVPPWAFIVLRPYVVDLPFKTIQGADEALVMYYANVDETKRDNRSLNPSFAAMMREPDADMLLLRGTVAVLLVHNGLPVDAVEGDIAKVFDASSSRKRQTSSVNHLLARTGTYVQNENTDSFAPEFPLCQDSTLSPHVSATAVNVFLRDFKTFSEQAIALTQPNRLRDRLPSTLSDDFFQNLSRNVFLTAIAYQFLSLKISAMEISLHEIASIVKNACDDGTLDASTAMSALKTLIFTRPVLAEAWQLTPTKPLIYKISYPCQLSVMHKSKRRSTRIRRTANVSVAPEPYGAYKFTPSPMVLAARKRADEHVARHGVRAWDFIMYPSDSASPALSKLPMKPGEHISTGVGSLQLNIYDPDVPPWAFIVLRPYVVDLPFKTIQGADEALVMYYANVDETKRDNRSLNPSFAAMMREPDADMLLLRGTVAVLLVHNGLPVDAVEGDIAKVTHHVCTYLLHMAADWKADLCLDALKLQTT
ncbi:hypothetical protein CC2G_000231 [Coprinopsis cinerea AmutBmut pab1-1]|nr:hypothetical protein CC2G_000231 [Coprinopsis cinerea AmutBmut pab1-1]